MPPQVSNRSRWLHSYFADLWVFCPYISLYLVWWACGFPSENLVPIFQGLHVVHGAGLIAVLWNFTRRHTISEVARGASFWIILILLFYLPGAYLEYPSDPWEHLRRLLRWQAGGAIGEYLSDVKDKFSYFWGWTFLSPLELGQRRSALDFYALFWQLVVAIQVYRLLRCCYGATRAAVGVIIFFAFFGTNIFGIRYYAISSSLLAYAAYMQVLIVIVRRSAIRYALLSLVYLALLAFMNHKQELLFIGFMGPVALYWTYRPSLSPHIRARISRGLVVIASVGLIAGMLARHLVLPPEQSVQLSFFGGLPIWSAFYLDTLGVAGWIGFISALTCVLFGRGTVVSYLVLTPLVVLLWPPTALVVLKSFPSLYLSYRLLYAMPAALGVLEGIALLMSLFPSVVHKRLIGVVSACVLMWIATQPTPPWRGRLWFAAHQAPQEREYGQLMPMVEWFQDSFDSNVLRGCWFITDDISRTILSFHVGAHEWVTGGEQSRRGQRQDGRLLTATQHITEVNLGERPVCGVLVYAPQFPPVIAPSTVATLSGHWRSNETDQNWHVLEPYRVAARNLVTLGWTKIQVPAGYELYLPPGARAPHG
jgi:hypothetical protein